MERSKAILIRPWHEGDDQDIWDVLKEGSYSNVNSTFISCFRRKDIRAVGFLLLSWLLVYGDSWTIVFYSIVGIITCIYTLSLLTAVVYLYGPTLKDIKNIRGSYFNQPGNHFWVAACDGRVVGTIAIVEKPNKLKGSPDQSFTSSETSRKVAWLRRMVVRKKYRGLGIAKKLVKECIIFCKEKKYDSIFLITTEIHHAARSLYCNLGFEFAAPCKTYAYGPVTVKTYEYVMQL